MTTRRTIRVADFKAESIREIASHFSSDQVEGLNNQAETAAASTDQTMVTILEGDPKRGNTVIFPSGDRLLIESVSARLVWFIGHEPIPVDDLAPNGEQGTWVYKGDRDTTKRTGK